MGPKQSKDKKIHEGTKPNPSEKVVEIPTIKPNHSEKINHVEIPFQYPLKDVDRRCLVNGRDIILGLFLYQLFLFDETTLEFTRNTI